MQFGLVDVSYVVWFNVETIQFGQRANGRE